MKTAQLRTAVSAVRSTLNTRIAAQAPMGTAYRAPASSNMLMSAPARTLRTSPVWHERDMSWVNRGPMTYEELKPYTKSPSGKISLIDVREPSEVAQGMIPSAVNVPLSQFPTAFDPNSDSENSVDFERKYSFPRPEFGDEICFYCRSGMRSQQALEFAQKRGWWNTRNYKGSMVDWTLREQEKGASEDED